MMYEEISVEKAKSVRVQFACISIFDLNRLGIKEEDICFFIMEVEK